MKTICKVAAIGTLALVAGTASAGRMEGGERSGLIVPISVVINHTFGSTSHVKSLLITVLEPFSGEVNPLVFILNSPTPVVTIDTVGGVPRTIESMELLNLPGGWQGVRWTFPDSNLWSQGERLVFSFSADFMNGNPDRLIGEDYTFVPTPCAAVLAGVGLMGMARRRR